MFVDILKLQLCFKIRPRIIKDAELLLVLPTFEFDREWKYKNTLTYQLNRI